MVSRKSKLLIPAALAIAGCSEPNLTRVRPVDEVDFDFGDPSLEALTDKCEQIRFECTDVFGGAIPDCTPGYTLDGSILFDTTDEDGNTVPVAVHPRSNGTFFQVADSLEASTRFIEMPTNDGPASVQTYNGWSEIIEVEISAAELGQSNILEARLGASGERLILEMEDITSRRWDDSLWRHAVRPKVTTVMLDTEDPCFLDPGTACRPDFVETELEMPQAFDSFGETIFSLRYDPETSRFGFSKGGINENGEFIETADMLQNWPFTQEDVPGLRPMDDILIRAISDTVFVSAMFFISEQRLGPDFELLTGARSIEGELKVLICFADFGESPGTGCMPLRDPRVMPQDTAPHLIVGTTHMFRELYYEDEDGEFVPPFDYIQPNPGLAQIRFVRNSEGVGLVLTMPDAAQCTVDEPSSDPYPLTHQTVHNFEPVIDAYEAERKCQSENDSYMAYGATVAFIPLELSEEGVDTGTPILHSFSHANAIPMGDLAFYPRQTLGAEEVLYDAPYDEPDGYADPYGGFTTVYKEHRRHPRTVHCTSNPDGEFCGVNLTDKWGLVEETDGEYRTEVTMLDQYGGRQSVIGSTFPSQGQCIGAAQSALEGNRVGRRTLISGGWLNPSGDIIHISTLSADVESGTSQRDGEEYYCVMYGWENLYSCPVSEVFE